LVNKIFSNIKFTEKALDAAWLRNKAISQNIANIDTPGYKRKTVIFEELLKNALDNNSEGLKTDSGHLEKGKDKVDNIDNIDNMQIRMLTDNKNLSTRLDGNNVDIDNESASMAKNTIKYNVLIQSINSSLKMLKSVISEGRR